MNTNNNSVVNFILKNRVAVCLGIMLLILLGSYICMFAPNGISSHVGDWASFGEYIGGALGAISVFLIYITYREQRKTNHQDHFEKVSFCHLKTIAKLQTTYLPKIEKMYNIIVMLFKNDLLDLKGYNKKDVESAISYIYTHINNFEEGENSISEFFMYIEYAVKHIDADTLIDNKSLYVYEVKNVLKVDSLVSLLFYLVSNNKTEQLHLYNQYRLFDNLHTDNALWNQTIDIFCPSSKSFIPSEENNFQYDDFNIDKNTSFVDVLEHLKLTKLRK